MECHPDIVRVLEKIIEMTKEELNYEVTPGVIVDHKIVMMLEHARLMVFDKPIGK